MVKFSPQAESSSSPSSSRHHQHSPPASSTQYTNIERDEGGGDPEIESARLPSEKDKDTNIERDEGGGDPEIELAQLPSEKDKYTNIERDEGGGDPEIQLAQLPSEKDKYTNIGRDEEGGDPEIELAQLPSEKDKECEHHENEIIEEDEEKSMKEGDQRTRIHQLFSDKEVDRPVGEAGLSRLAKEDDSSRATPLVWIFTGASVVLFVWYAYSIHHSSKFFTGNRHMDTFYPVISIVALLCLHLWVYALNIWIWKATKIDYISIFKFNPETCLKHVDAFIIGMFSLVVLLLCLVLHQFLISKGYSARIVDAVPSFLVAIFIGVILLPHPYRPTRNYFIQLLPKIVCPMRYEVGKVESFFANQLTSQTSLLRHVAMAVCYSSAAASLEARQFGYCNSGHYRRIAYVISFAPYLLCLLQCLRRWLDESDRKHLYNMGKFLTTMVAASCRLIYAYQDNLGWQIIATLTSSGATIYQLYWDLAMDWNLLSFHSKKPWLKLRDKQLLKNKSVYYICIVVNVVMRISWVETVLSFDMNKNNTWLVEGMLAAVEIIRRGISNFYRLENEALG